MPRTINQAGIDLIKSFEGLRLRAYRDSVGVPTIGYGHTKGVKMGTMITKAQAEQMLKEDLVEYSRYVQDALTICPNDNQFAALVSFTYNLGPANLKRSTLLRKVNAEDFTAAAAEFAKWNRAGGEVLAGLTRRRAAERKLFLTP